MSRHLLCPECDKKYAGMAAKYQELYESTEGKSIGSFLCDGCVPPKPVLTGDICFAAVLLTNKEHPNYVIQKPDAWMDDYLIPAKQKTLNDA